MKAQLKAQTAQALSLNMQSANAGGSSTGGGSGGGANSTTTPMSPVQSNAPRTLSASALLSPATQNQVKVFVSSPMQAMATTAVAAARSGATTLAPPQLFSPIRQFNK